MILAYLILGMMFGTFAAAASLVFGSSVLLALAVYSGVGSISVLLLATFRYAWLMTVEIKDRKPDAFGPYWRST